MSIIKQFFHSLYSAKDMAAYRHQKVQKSVIFVLFLSLLTTIPTFLSGNQLLQEGVQYTQQFVSEELPEFSIIDGVLKAEDNEPVVKHSPTFSFLFDPTAEDTGNTFRHSDSYLAFLQERFIISIAGQRDSRTYANFGLQVQNKEEVVQFFQSLENLLPVISLVLFLITFVVVTFIQFATVTFFAYLARIFSRSARRNLTYKECWSIVACTLTIPTMFFFITDLLDITIIFGSFIQTFSMFFLLFFVIREIEPVERVE